MVDVAEVSNHDGLAVWLKRGQHTWALVQRTWHGLAPRTRFLIIVGGLVFLLAGIYGYVSAGSATMNLVVRHPFRAAKLVVRVDGSELYSGEINGASAKRVTLFGKSAKLFGTNGGTHSNAFSVRPGKRNVEIEITAAGYHQVQSASATFVRGSQTTVTAGVEHGELFVNSRGANSVESGGSSASFLSMASPLLLTICGSAMSAIIGFFVQEFLRSRRAATALAAQRQTTTTAAS
jgi:hypothetical protein